MEAKTVNVYQVIDCETELALFSFDTEEAAMLKMRRCKGDVTVEMIVVPTERVRFEW